MTTDTIAVDGIDVGLTVRPLSMLSGDPTIRVTRRQFTRATWTPDGPATIVVRWHGSVADAETHGPGAAWLMERAPGLIGCLDDASSFNPPNGIVRRIWSRHHGDRVSRTSTVWHDLAWSIVQQRVRQVEAAASWRRLTKGYGHAAPGVADMRTPPAPDAVARSSISQLRSLGLDGQRAGTLIQAARVAHRLHTLAEQHAEDALRKLSSLPGIGPWTTSCLSAFTWGDPDTVIVGDVGIPSLIAHRLAGERRADDQRMLELLDPYRPHRYRVLKLVFAAGTRAR